MSTENQDEHQKPDTPSFWTHKPMPAPATCQRDTNRDGDCHICRGAGCPLSLFRPCVLDRMVMSSKEENEFIRGAVPFRYEEEGGVIEGFRKGDRVLITSTNLLSNNIHGIPLTHKSTEEP